MPARAYASAAPPSVAIAAAGDASQRELAWAVAGVGRRDEAARELGPVLRGDLTVIEWDRPFVAEACLMAGNDDCAVAQIARLIAEHRFYTPAIFRLDPVWEPLRKRADFKKLVEAQ
jgi:hypothetical protein